MKNKIRVFMFIALLLAAGIFLAGIFIPRHYTTPPIVKSSGFRFMDLPTGSRIGYILLAGKGVKKPFPIVYLHGGPGGRITESNIRILSGFTEIGYDVLLYDQVGSGTSARLDNILDYTVDRHIDDLHEIIRNLGAAKVILIGQSWGGILAAYYSSKFPNNVAKIIFTNPGPLFPYPAELDTLKAPDSLNLKQPVFTNEQGNSKVKNLRVNAMKFFALQFGIKLTSDNEADEFNTCAGYEINKSTVYDTSKIEKLPDVKSIPSLSGYYAGIMTFKSLVEGRDRRLEIKHSEIPVLVLKSQYDNQKWGYTSEYLKLFRNHMLRIIPRAGHAITIEQPVLYIKYISRFLQD